MSVIGPNEADANGMVRAEMLADARVAMEALRQTHVQAWQEVDRLNHQLRGAVEALREARTYVERCNLAEATDDSRRLLMRIADITGGQ